MKKSTPCEVFTKNSAFADRPVMPTDAEINTDIDLYPMAPKHYIATYKGHRFYPQDSRIDRIDIEDVAHGLAHQCRFNGHTEHFYSVAQHSLVVAMQLPPARRLAGLLHDAAEAYVGDMVSPLKAEMPAFAAAEVAVLRQIGSRFCVDLSDEGGLVHLADLVALATEKRDLLPNSPEPWPHLQGIDPLPCRITPKGPRDAKQAFLEAWYAWRCC